MTKDQKNLLLFKIDNLVKVGAKLDNNERVELLQDLRDSIQEMATPRRRVVKAESVEASA